MSSPQGKPDLDLDEDLFDFAEVRREPDPPEDEEDLEQIFASFRDAEPEEELLAIPAAPASTPAPVPGHAPSAPPEPAPRAVARAEPEPASAAPAASPRRSTPEPGPSPAAPSAREAVVEHTPLARPSRFSRSLVAVAAAVTLLNTVVAVVVLRGRSDDHDVRAVAPDTALGAEAHERDAHAAPPNTSAARLPEPERVGTVADHPALDEARRQISHGEYGAARQRVYGLLAIIDRLEDPRRSALEADCQFLIAQSLHLEALARMGGSE